MMTVIRDIGAYVSRKDLKFPKVQTGKLRKSSLTNVNWIIFNLHNVNVGDSYLIYDSKISHYSTFKSSRVHQRTRLTWRWGFPLPTLPVSDLLPVKDTPDCKHSTICRRNDGSRWTVHGKKRRTSDVPRSGWWLARNVSKYTGSPSTAQSTSLITGMADNVAS